MRVQQVVRRAAAGWCEATGEVRVQVHTSWPHDEAYSAQRNGTGGAAGYVCVSGEEVRFGRTPGILARSVQGGAQGEVQTWAEGMPQGLLKKGPALKTGQKVQGDYPQIEHEHKSGYF